MCEEVKRSDNVCLQSLTLFHEIDPTGRKFKLKSNFFVNRVMVKCSVYFAHDESTGIQAGSLLKGELLLVSVLVLIC